MRPLADGVRAVGIEARQVSTRDILLAHAAQRQATSMPTCRSRASMRAEIAADGTPQMVQGQFIVGRRHVHRSRRRQRHCRSRSIAPISDSIGMRGGAAWSCRFRSRQAATNSPCAPRWRRRPTTERRLAVQCDARRSGDRPDDPGAGGQRRRRGLCDQPRGRARAHRYELAAASSSNRAISAASIRGPRTMSASRSPAAWIIRAPSRISPSASPARACRCR